MSILKIRKFNDKVLRKRAVLIEEINEEIKDLVANMAETMVVSNGIGLAAPQIGISKRVIVVQADPKDQSVLSLINPKIIKKSKERIKVEEGCLSFPNIYIEITRPKEIEVEALSINGKKVNLKIDGLLARVIQHEIDHLDGIVFMRRLDFIEKIKFKLKHFSLKL